MEILVTKPLEEAISGVEGIAAVRSQSIQGLSVITAVLAEKVDIYRARQALAERLGEAVVRLPDTVHPPVLTPLTSSSSTVLVVGITSRTRTPMEQRTFANWVLRPRLLATPGVSKVAIFGGEVRQLQIQLDPDRMRLYGIGLAEVTEAARRSTGMRGAGVLDGINQRLTVRAEGQALTPAALGNTVVRESGGSALHLSDVAHVVEGAEPRVGEGAVNGERGLVIVVSAQLGANTKVVAQRRGGRRCGASAPPSAAAGLTLHPALFRPSEFIDLALRNVTSSLLLGAVLVAVVLFIFLSDAGAAAISLTAIPLSLLAAIVVLDAMGFGLNTLTLGGLAIALGEVVDDAIIDVENIARRLRENLRAGEPRSARERGAGGVARSARQRGLRHVRRGTRVHAGAGAHRCAGGAVPAARAGLRPGHPRIARRWRSPSRRHSRSSCSAGGDARRTSRRRSHGSRPDTPALLDWLADRPVAVAGAAAALCLAAIATLPFFGATFLPEFREGHYLIHMSAVPGTSLDESRAARGAR